jgi:hypothetical protein
MKRTRHKSKYVKLVSDRIASGSFNTSYLESLMSYAEVAERMGMSHEAVRMIEHRALAKLLKGLECVEAADGEKARAVLDYLRTEQKDNEVVK